MSWEAPAGGAPQSTPLAIVSSAVAGNGIERVARSASEALGHPVAIILPSVGAPVVWPADALTPDLLRELVDHAVALADGAVAETPLALVHVEPIRIGQAVVGIVATTAGFPGNGAGAPQSDWLEATAAAAAVTRLMHDGVGRRGGQSGSGLARRTRAGCSGGYSEVGV